jgi:hypothetical protein
VTPMHDILRQHTLTVMAGLDPAISTTASGATNGRVKPGHDNTRQARP